MKMQEITLNGFTLWSLYGNKRVFARQLEPTKGLYDDEQHGALVTPILVGYDGEEGRELSAVLSENERLTRRVEELQDRASSYEVSELDRITRRLERLERLERPWWRRLFKKQSN